MPPTLVLHRRETHRLIPAVYSQSGSVLEKLGLPAEVLSDLSEVDAATNERRVAERGGNPAIGPGELLMGVPESRIVNAAFCHPGPMGARFSGARRGAWYAGFELQTSFAEVAYHKRAFLRDMRFSGELAFEYQDFLADFMGEFHLLASAEGEAYLKPEPVPQCYAAGQALADTLLHSGSLGIVYPSVRRPEGTCIACFRPALVQPRRAGRYEITVSSGSSGFAVREL